MHSLEPLSECIVNLESVPKNRVLAYTTQTTFGMRKQFQELMLKNPPKRFKFREFQKSSKIRKKYNL